MIGWLVRVLGRVKVKQPETRPPEAVAGELETLRADSATELDRQKRIASEFRSIERAVAKRR